MTIRTSLAKARAAANRGHPKRVGLAAALAATALLSPLVASSTPAGATSLASAQAQAAQLAAQISAEQSRVDSLSQAYDAAQIKVTSLDSQVAAAKVALAQMAANVTKISATLRQQAINSWVNQGGTSPMQDLLEGNASTFVVRQQFMKTVAGSEQDTIDQLNIATRAEHAKQVSLNSAQAAADAALRSVANDRQAAENETSAYQATLAQVHGQIATIVAQIQAQKEAAQQAAAAAAAQQLAAQQAAAAAAAAQQSPSPSGGGSSSSGVGLGQLPTTPPPSGSGASAAVAVALQQVGTPYVYGGSEPGGFDCSGLVMYAWAAAGVDLPHYTVAQYDETTQIPIADAQPGDIVFYDVPGEAEPGHEALYIGGGQVVSANETGTNVQTQSIYYDGTVMGVGRVG